MYSVFIPFYILYAIFTDVQLFLKLLKEINNKRKKHNILQDGSISELNIMPLHKREMLKLFRQTGIFLHPGIPGYLYTCIRTLKKASIRIRDASKHSHYILHTQSPKADPNTLAFYTLVCEKPHVKPQRYQFTCCFAVQE